EEALRIAEYGKSSGSSSRMHPKMDGRRCGDDGDRVVRNNEVQGGRTGRRQACTGEGDGDGGRPGLGGRDGQGERPERDAGPAYSHPGSTGDATGHYGGTVSAARLWSAAEPTCGRAGVGEDDALGCERRFGCGRSARLEAAAGDDSEDSSGEVRVAAAPRATRDGGVCADGG